MILTIKDQYVGEEITLPILMEVDAFKLEASASVGYTEISKYLNCFVLEIVFGYIYEEIRDELCCSIAEFNSLSDDEKDVAVEYVCVVDGNNVIEDVTILAYLTSKGRPSSTILNRGKKKLAAEQRSIGLLTSDTIDVIGKGTGASKPSTSIHGTTTLSEDFSVGNELYLHWVVPNDIDTENDLTIKLSWFPIASESSKTISWELKYTTLTTGDDTNTVTGTLTAVDETVPSTADENTMTVFTLPKEDISGKHAIHFRLKRISSTNDLSDRVAVHHMTINYYLI